MQCGLVSYDAETIMREIDLKRIHGSSASPFKRNDLIWLMNNIPNPIMQRDYSNNLCPILIYEKLKYNKVYMLVADPSEGLSQDNNAMVLINPSTQKIAAEFKSPYIAQRPFGKMIIQFLTEFCPKTIIIVESNKGRELINYFLETTFADQLYYDDGKLGDKVVDKTDPYGRLKREATIRRAYGHWTGSNRSQYYGILENIMEERKNILLSKYLVEDICGLIRKPNGRVEAGQGAHDDIVMAYLIGMFIYLMSPYEKLEEYGIHRGESDIMDEEDEVASPEVREKNALNKLKEMMSSLPENMRVLIQDTLNQKDPVTEAEEFQKKVQSTRQKFEDGDYSDTEDLMPTQHPSDVARMSQFDNSIWQSNEREPDPWGNDYPTSPVGDGSFDVDDWI